MASKLTDQPAVDRTGLAVGAIVLAVMALSLGDALIKWSSASFSIWQIYVLRSVAALPILLAVPLFRSGAVRWRLQRPGWGLARSLLLASMWLIYYAALPFVPLSVAAAAYYTLPLFIVLLAGLFLEERIGVSGWLAVGLGFAGVIVLLRPTGDDVNFYALLPVVSALLYAVAMVLTRSKCVDEDPMALSLALNLTFVAMGGIGTGLVWFIDWSDVLTETYPFVFGAWAEIGLLEGLVIVGLGGIIVVGSVLTAVAYQNGRASVVSVFDYAYLVFAAVWGLLIFAEVPDVISIVGMIMIVGAGILATLR